ncbi:hypothetical protein WA158_000022 [Blastocystis sp. Blastoise]
MQGYGTVKSVISGDTIVLMANVKKGIAPEMQLNLAYCMAPRVARGPEGMEEPFGWESREYLRKHAIGQVVKFQVLYKVDAIGRTFANIWLGEKSLCEDMVSSGWCRVKAETKEEGDSELYEQLMAAEGTAKSHSLGVWNTTIPKARQVDYEVADAEKFFKNNKGLPFAALIEQVRDGSTFKVLLFESNKMITFHLAGIQCPKPAFVPKNSNESATPDEPLSREAKAFTEARLLNRSVILYMDGLDKFHTFFGHIEHPKGDITKELLKNGLARIVDWSLNYRTAADAISLRNDEIAAKRATLGIWKNYKPVNSAAGTTVRVLEVVSGDCLLVTMNPRDYLAEPKRVYLSSIRAPKMGSIKRNVPDEPYAYNAKEALRKLVIGKEVTLKVDYTRTITNTEGDLIATYVTITVGKKEMNVAEELVKRGLATVMHHKDEDPRSPIYDQLLIAETTAKDTKKGQYSRGSSTRLTPVDLSENSNKAKSFLPFLKRNKTMTATILYIGNGSRYRIYIPQENCECVFILEGIKSPAVKTGKAQSEACAEAALAFARYHFMQREVTIEVDTQDKAGNIIGYMYIEEENNNKDIATFMLKNGYASIQEMSIDRCRDASIYKAAEEEAKKMKKGIWKNYVEVVKKVEEVKEEVYMGEVCNIEGNTIYIQTDRDLERLDQIEAELENYNKNHILAMNIKRNGIYVAYSQDNKLYARIRIEETVKDSSILKYKVVYIDYGFKDTINNNVIYEYTNSLNIPPLARASRFAFLTLPSPSFSLYNDIYNDYLDLMDEATYQKKLQIHVLGRDSENRLLIILSDPADKKKQSINNKVARDGLVVLDKKNKLNTYPAILSEYVAALDAAKKDRCGVFTYGDYDDDDEE